MISFRISSAKRSVTLARKAKISSFEYRYLLAENLKTCPLLLPLDDGMGVAESGVDKARSLAKRRKGRGDRWVTNERERERRTNHSGPKFNGCVVC